MEDSVEAIAVCGKYRRCGESVIRFELLDPKQRKKIQNRIA